MRGVCFCEKAHFSFFIYPHVVLRNSVPFSQWHNHFTGDQHPIMLMQPFDDTSAPAVTHKKRDTSPTFTASRLRLASSRDIET